MKKSVLNKAKADGLFRGTVKSAVAANRFLSSAGDRRKTNTAARNNAYLANQVEYVN